MPLYTEISELVPVPPPKSPEPTAVGAVTSAIAVHVASRATFISCRPPVVITMIILTISYLLFGCSKSPEQLKSEFFEAVKHDNCSQAIRLIKQGVNVNQPETPGGWSALHFAAQIGSENMVKTLLAAGADPNYIGTAPGQQGTIIGLKPLPVAQASLVLAQSYQSNPSMTNYFVVDERLKDPKAVDRYKSVCSILEKVTSN